MKNTLYKNKFRIDTIRLKGWNYTQDGMYFVTICTNCRDAINRVSTIKSGGVTYKHNPMLNPHSLSTIIRNEESLGRVREYIRDNQLKWEFDRNNPECKPYVRRKKQERAKI